MQAQAATTVAILAPSAVLDYGPPNFSLLT